MVYPAGDFLQSRKTAGSTYQLSVQKKLVIRHAVFHFVSDIPDIYIPHHHAYIRNESLKIIPE